MLSPRNNFDLLRLGLALIVVFAHLAILSGAREMAWLTKLFDAGLAVDAFFVVSGFLVYMSFERSRGLGEYFGKRMRRILPGYVAVVVLCALLLFGLSARNAAEYFSSDWLGYLAANLAFLNFLHPTLPGVFEENRLHAVNGALWTIKVEVMFYLMLPLLARLAARFSPMAVFATVYVLSVAYSLLMFHYAQQGHIYAVLERQLPGQLAFFVSGMMLYAAHDAFRRRAWAGVAPALLIVFLARHADAFYPLYPLALAWLVIHFATVVRHFGNWGRFGDFSYGVYIWHFPWIQALISWGVFDVSPWLGAVATLAGVLVLAFASWHLIERPFLQRTSHYRMAEGVPAG